MLACKAVCRKIVRPEQPAVRLLDNISFSLEKGATLAVLGASGAGKSTLLRVLNRLDEPTRGTIMLAGTDTASIAPRELRRRIGMVMQRAYLFPGSVADNIRFGPAQCGQLVTDEEVRFLLDEVGLGGYQQRETRTLSGGEGQRVALARALANHPQVLLLDEPTSALDDDAKESVEQLLLSVMRQEALTCVWVTHDRKQARRISQRALVLDAGTVAADGPVSEVLDA